MNSSCSVLARRAALAAWPWPAGPLRPPLALRGLRHGRRATPNGYETGSLYNAGTLIRGKRKEYDERYARVLHSTGET